MTQDISKALTSDDKKRIARIVTEISNSKTRQEAESDFQKEAKKELKETMECEAKLVNRMVAAYHKDRFKEDVAQDEEFAANYAFIFDEDLTEGG
jgi:hypothetical protein